MLRRLGGSLVSLVADALLNARDRISLALRILVVPFAVGSLSPGNRRQQLLAGSTAVEPEMDSADVDEYDHMAGADDSAEDLFYSALTNCVIEAHEANNTSLLDVINVAASAFEQAEEHCAESHGQLDMYTATLLHAHATIAERVDFDADLPFTNFLGWIGAYVHRNKSTHSRRAPWTTSPPMRKATGFVRLAGSFEPLRQIATRS